MGENVPQEGSPEKAPQMKLAEKIKQTAIERDEVTRNLLSGLLAGQSARTFVEKACKLADITPPQKNDSLAVSVFNLQKDILHFSPTDTYDGCDGKLGPITFDALIKKFPALNPRPRQRVVAKSKKERRNLISKAGLPTPPSSLRPTSDVEREPIVPSGVAYFGDSLTQQYVKYILSKAEFRKHKSKDFKIGRWALTMRKRMKRNLDYYAGKKAIVIGAGTNDRESRRSAEAIFGDIKAMYTMLLKKNPNIQIVALTLISCPGKPRINRKTEIINRKIREFASRFPRNIRVIDLHRSFSDAMSKGRRMLYGDRVHMRPKASKAVARMIQDSITTGAHRDIEEYLS